MGGGSGTPERHGVREGGCGAGRPQPSQERWVLRGTGAVGGLGGIECFQLSATLRCGVSACFGAWGSSPRDPLSSDQNQPRGAAGVGCRLRTANRGWGAAALAFFQLWPGKVRLPYPGGRDNISSSFCELPV